MPRKALVAAAIAVAAVVAAVTWWVRSQEAGDRDAIRLSGNIEVTSAQVSFKTPGRVRQRLVSEGESVTNGQPVARLDRTEMEQEVAMRRAEAQAAEAALAELEAGTRPEEIEQAAAAADAARAEEKRVRSELARQRDLFDQKAIAPREFEAAEAAANTAAARLREAEARLTLLRNGPREETIRGARARAEQARQAVALAETHLADAELASPLTGVVLSEGVEAGEYVVPGAPVVTVADLERVWLRAYVGETDLGRVRLGQPVRVTADTYPGKAYAGRLSFISSEAEFTPKSVQTADERVRLVYRVKIDIANPAGELKPGMPADAEIEVR